MLFDLLQSKAAPANGKAIELRGVSTLVVVSITTLLMAACAVALIKCGVEIWLLEIQNHHRRYRACELNIGYRIVI